MSDRAAAVRAGGVPCLAVLLAGLLAPLSAQRPATQDLVWPPPPEAPRIRYVGSLTSEADVGKKESFFGRLKRTLSGRGAATNFGIERPFDVLAEGGRFYVTDGLTPGVVVFDRATHAARLLGRDVPGGMSRPMGLGGDGTGRVYVTDADRARVVVFSPSGHYERTFGGPDALLNPVDVAVDAAAGRFYVVDSYLHQVVVFDPTGAVAGRIGRHEDRPSGPPPALPDSTLAPHHGGTAAGHPTGEPRDHWRNRGGDPGEFRYPVAAVVAPDGRLYVSDQMNFRVQVFDRDGTFLRQVGQLGDVPGSFARPKGVALDSQGHLYVADAAFSNVQVFDGDGRLLLAFGTIGTGEGNHWVPLGLSIDRDDRIYVADRYNNRAQIYQYLPDSIPAPRPTPAGRTGAGR